MVFQIFFIPNFDLPKTNIMRTKFLSPSILSLIFFGFFNTNAQVGINTTNPQASLDILSKGSTGTTKAMRINNSSNTEIVTVTDEGRVGIGTSAPQHTLHSIGTLRFEGVNTGQASGMVLTSNDNLGTATWQRAASNVVTGTLGGGYNLPFAQTSTMSYTGSFITLPPGKWMLTISLLLIPSGTIPATEWMFVRSTFSDQNLTTIGQVGTQSADVIRPTLMSFQITGPFTGGQKYNVATGTIQINNTSGTTKTYRYIVGGTQASSTIAGAQLSAVGGSWSENAIYAIATN